MTFYANKIEEFLRNFNDNQEHIRSFDCVEKLELLNDKNNPNIYFTYSIWKSEEYLEKYRNSYLFKSVWATTKPLFSEKVEYWSLESVVNLD